MTKTNPTAEARTVIDNLGGPSAVAVLCGLKPATITYWLKVGIPRPWRLWLLCAHPYAFTQVSPLATTDIAANSEVAQAAI